MSEETGGGEVEALGVCEGGHGVCGEEGGGSRADVVDGEAFEGVGVLAGEHLELGRL